MDIAISLRGKIILGSGTLVLTEIDTGFDIAIADIRVLFDFIENGGETETTGEVIDPKNLRLILKNTGNPLGISLNYKDIADVNGEKISIALYIIANQTSPVRRSISYTITSRGDGS